MNFTCWRSRFCWPLLAGALVLGLGGCGCRQEPAGLLPAADAGTGATPAATPSSHNNASGQEPKTRWPTDFNCPLDIHIEAPKVPEKLREASSPLNETSSPSKSEKK